MGSLGDVVLVRDWDRWCREDIFEAVISGIDVL
jgi:hypothetical protein